MTAETTDAELLSMADYWVSVALNDLVAIDPDAARDVLEEMRAELASVE